MSTTQRRILIVEDDELVLDSIDSTLQKLGYAVSTAINGKAALRQLEQDSDIDVILMDISLPDINGISLLADIMKRPSHPQIIIMTGAAEANIFEAMRDGAAGFLLKPFSMETLRTSIEACFPAA